MTIPDAAIEAAIEGLKKWDILTAKGREDFARTAIEAAMPAIREAIAQEIEAAHPRCTEECPMCAAYDENLAIVRGGAA